MDSSDPIIIGFGYKTKHGKDTAAAHCAAKWSGKYDVRRYALADALKVEVYDALCNPLDPYWETTKDYFLLPHPSASVTDTDQSKIDWVNANKQILGNHLQLYGTEYRRSKDRFYWVKRLHAKILADNPLFALVTDVRLPNEFLYVKAHKGYMVKCNRIGYVNPDRNPNHISETALDDVRFDFEIQHADGNVQELYDGVDEVFEHILKIYDVDYSTELVA